MARTIHEWLKMELYNKDGVQVFVIRAKDNNKLRTWAIVENGVERTVTHEEAAVYIDPDYGKRIERKKARRANMVQNKLTQSEWGYNYLPEI